MRWFEGNFTDYEAYRRKELGADADQPTASSTSRWLADAAARPAQAGARGSAAALVSTRPG